MKPGNEPIAAANRAVMEELRSILNGSGRVKIVPGSYCKKVEERSSASYPGLPACYEVHSVVATVEGLPEEDFVTEEEHEYEDSGERRVASEAVSVKKHFWKWGLELELRKLEGAVEAIHENLLFLKSREAEMRTVSEKTNTRVAWFSIMSLGVRIAVSSLQLWHLKRFFQKKLI